MRVIDRNTGEPVIFKSYIDVIKRLYSPVYASYLDISILMQKTIKEYENAELVPYKMTAYEKYLVRQNPDYIENIPRYHVPGFDLVVGGAGFEQKLKKEFYQRFVDNDKRLAKLIRMYHPDYVAYVE